MREAKRHEGIERRNGMMEWIDGMMDGWMDGWMEIYALLSTILYRIPWVLSLPWVLAESSLGSG